MRLSLAFRPLRERSLGRQAIAIAGASGIAQLVNALIFIRVARVTSPANFGAVVAIISASSALAGALDFGSNTHWTREIASKRMSIEEYRKRLVGKLFIVLLIVLVVTIGIVLFGGDRRYLMGPPVALAIVFEQAAIVRLSAAAQGQRVAFAMLFDKVIVATAMATVVVSHRVVVDWLWLCLTLGSIAGGSLAIMLARRGRERQWLALSRGNPWRGARSYGIFGLAVSVQGMDLALMSSLGGPYVAGVYGAVNRWTQPMSLLSASFSSASIPFVARANSSRAAIAALRKAIWLPMMSIIGCIVVAASAGPLVETLLGRLYADATEVLRLLAIAALFSVLNQPLVAFLQARRHESRVTWAMLSVLPVQFGLLVVLVPRLGAVGAGVASVAAQTALLFGLALSVVQLHRKGAH